MTSAKIVITLTSKRKRLIDSQMSLRIKRLKLTKRLMPPPKMVKLMQNRLRKQSKNSQNRRKRGHVDRRSSLDYLNSLTPVTRKNLPNKKKSHLISNKPLEGNRKTRML